MKKAETKKSRLALRLSLAAGFLLLATAGGLYLFRPQPLAENPADIQVLLLEYHQTREQIPLDQALQDDLAQLLSQVQLRRSLKYVPRSRFVSDHDLEIFYYERETGRPFTLYLGKVNVLFQGGHNDRWHQYIILEPKPEALSADILALAQR